MSHRFHHPLIWLGIVGVVTFATPISAAFNPSQFSVFNTLIPANSNNTQEMLLLRVVRTAFFIAGVVALVYLMIGAFKYATAGGEEEKSTSAKLTIIYAVVAILLTISVYFILNATVNAVTVNPATNQLGL